MKKITGTKVKRYMAGPLAFVTAMIFSLPGNMQAQQSQTISAPSINDVIYGVAPFSVAATSSSGLAVSYGVAGPATVDTDGLLTALGKGSVSVFFFQNGSADYYPAAPVVKSFTVNGASATVTLADATVAYTGTGQSLTPTQTDSAGNDLSEPYTVTYKNAAGATVVSPTSVGVYTATAAITSGSNYAGSDTGTLTITQAAATVTISGISHSHDGSQKPVTVVTVPAGLTVTTTYTGGSFAPAAAVAEVLYVEGDTLPDGKVVGDVKTAAVAAITAPSTAGDYAVSVSVVDDSYSGSATATLTIGSVTIDNTAVTYTGAAQAPAVTLVPADLTHTVTYTDSAGAAVTSPANAGTYTVLVTVSDTRYPGDTSASYTINPAALTATLGSLSTSYGLGAPSATEWAATLGYSAFAGTDTAAVVDTAGLTVSYDKAVSDGGSYVSTPAGLSSGNYAITYAAGSLTVGQLSASVALSNTTQGYTGSVLGVTATPSVEGLAVTVVYRDANGVLVAAPTAQGTYYVTATIDDVNYAGSKTGTLTITKATTTLELPDLPDIVYSADPITVDATVTGERPILFFVTGAASATGNVVTLNSAGTVRVTAYVAGTDDYESAYEADTFTVSKAGTSVTLADADVVYTGLGQSLTPSVADTSGNTLTVQAIDVVYKDASGNTVASPTDAGVYTVTATVNDTRYGGSSTGTLTILKSPLTITADDQTKEYLQANPSLTLTYTGLQNGEDSSVLSTQATVGTGADASSSLGEYGIVVYGAAAANYVITHVDGTLTVEKNTVVITFTGLSQTYTGSALAVTATPSVADVSLVVTYADAAGAAVASPTNAGTYTVTATVGSALYRGTKTGSLVIGKATAIVTLSDLAATYDGSGKVAATTTDPAGLTVDLTYSQGSTLVAPIAAVDAVAAVLYVEGDTLPTGKAVGDVKTPAVVAVTGVTGPSNAGTYAIVGSVNEANYLGYVTGDLVIAKKALSATADAKTKAYGSANPAATITYSGFENSEDATALDTAPAATIGADATSGAGDYDITLSAGTDNNYEITTANAKLTVGKAVLTVTASDDAKIYGEAIGAIGFSFAGLVNGDFISAIDTQPTVTSSRVATSDVGTYPTTAAGGADNNYSFAYIDGVLTVSKATATIALSDLSRDYDGKAAGATVTTTPTGLEGSVIVKYDGSTNEPVFVASYAVTASMDDKNYSADDVTGTYTISQGTATYVTLAELPNVYYGTAPLDLGLRSSTGGRVMVFVSGPAEVANDTDRLVTINDVGTVDILLYAFGAGIPTEYRFQAASFEVLKRNLIITADNKSRAYGADNPALTYTIQGFAPGEDESVFSTAPALTTAAASTTGVGDVAITFATEAVDGTGRYNVIHAPGTLTVAKAPLTVTGVDQSRTYGDGNPDGPTTQGLRVREYRDIGGTQVGDLTGNAKYPDAYDFQGVAGYFEWPQSGDINTNPAGNVRDNYGVVLEGYLTPTETASYEFYLAADDHAELWLSTDSDPANLVKIANEPQWNGMRSFAGTDRRAKVDVDTITITAPSALDVATTAGGIAAAINAGSSDTSAKVTATSSAGVVTITAAETNSAISIASEVTNGGTDDTQSGVLATATAAAAGVAQVITYTVSGVIEAGDSLKLTITGPRLETTSPAIVLAAGTSYYVRALMKEGGGGDNIAVTWIKSGEAAPANDALPIPGSVLTPASTVTFNYAGFVNGEDSSALTTQPSASVDISATTDAGEYEFVVSDASSPNYEINYDIDAGQYGPDLVVNGSFEADAVPAWPGYGAITDWVGGSGVNNDVSAASPFADNGAIPDGSNVAFIQGSKTISQTVAGLKSGEEYVLSYSYNTRNCCGGTIGLTASVDGNAVGSVDAVSPVGGANAYHTASHNFVATASETELVFAATAAGDATLLLDAVAIKSVPMHKGTVTIDPAVLTVQAGNKEVFETVSLPELTYTYSGFLNGEDSSVVTAAPSLSTDADNTVPGDYAIVPSGAVASNYAVVHVNGTMKIKTVTKPRVTSLAVSNSRPLVGDKVILTASTTGDLLTYEWYYGNTLLEGETSSTLVLNDISTDQSGRYSVFAKNLKGKSRKLARITVSERANNVFLVVGSEPAAPKDITSPSDTIVGTSTNTPGAEGVANAIDNNSSTKYLNFDKVNTGMTITTAGGVVTAIALTSANDSPERDPANYILSGSNDSGATFTEISAGDIPSFGSRFERKVVSISNDKEYKTYKLIFPTVANEGGANSMQIAEVELLAKAAVPAGSTDLAVGEYPIIPSGAVAANYAINNVNGIMTVKTVAKPRVTGLAVSNSNPIEGDKITLTATVTGDLLTYEWYLGSKLLEGETSSTLVINDIGTDQSGRYSVFGKNFKGKSRKLSKVTVLERANEVFLVVGKNTSGASDEGLIAEWDFNDTSDSAGSVDSVASIKGVFAGGAKYGDGRAGAGAALDLNGSGTAVMLVEEGGFINAATTLNTVTVAFWQKVVTRTSSSSFWAFSPTNNRVFQAHNPWGAGDIYWDAANTAGRINRGWGGDFSAWNHFAFVKDGNAEAIYVNGQILTSGTMTAILSTDATRFAVGAMIDSATSQGTSSLEGSIDDFKVYAKGLTADQIAAMYLSGVAPPPITYSEDLALKQLLEGEGFKVTMQGPGRPVSDVDPSHMSFVVISSTLQDDSWAAKYAGTTAPVINLDGSAQDALGFLYPRDDLSGSVSSAIQVEIVDAGHPLAGGLSAGAQTVLSAAGTLGWGAPNAAAAVVATAGTASHQAAVYGYEAGSSMAGGIDAAARRVNLPFQTSDLGSLTDAGGALLVAAVDWVSSFSIVDTGGDLSATVGDSIVLDGKVTGDNITLQWYKDGAAIAGATSSSLDLGAVQASNSGTYKMVATDAAAAWKYRFKEISYEVSVSARGGEVVLVTGADALSASDTAVKGILTSKGYAVVPAAAADASAADLDGRLMVVVSSSVATSGGTIYENTSSEGAFFASVKEFGDEVNLGLNNRLLDSLSFEYYGDFTADGDEKAVVRIYANDGAGTVTQQPGTMLYESDPIAIAAGYNSVNVSGLLIEVPDTITWTVQFFGVGNTAGDRAGLVLHDPPSVGSSFDDFWINTGDVIYNSTSDSLEAYYKTGTEFGDEINLAGSSRLLNEIDFEAYAEISSAPSTPTATLRIYANDGPTYKPVLYESTSQQYDVYYKAGVEFGDEIDLKDAGHAGLNQLDEFSFEAYGARDYDVLYDSASEKYEVYYQAGVEFGDEIDLSRAGNLDEISFEAYGHAAEALATTATLRIYANDGAQYSGSNVAGNNMPGTLLYTSDAIVVKDGYQTYTVSGIGGVSLPDKVTWTVEFTAGSAAGLVLGGTDVAGSSLNDFWQKDATGWTLYQPDNNASENADFVAKLKSKESTATLRIYANDGDTISGSTFDSGDYGAKKPGTLLYTSDAITLEAGYQTYTVSDISGVSLPDKVTWTVEFSAGSAAGLVLGGTDVVGSSLNDFWQKDGTAWTLYQADNASEDGDFAAQLTAMSPYIDSKVPGTLLFTSDPITLSEGYNTYQVAGIKVELPDTVTWTVEFSGVTGNELNVGNRAALVLSGTDVVGSSLDDFWQKDESGWMIYQTSSSTQTDDFAAKLVAQSWRSYRDTDSVVLDNFGARVTAGVNVDFLETAGVPLVVVNPGLQADWGVADNATFDVGAAMPSGAVAPNRRAFVSTTDDSAAIGQAIDWVLETGFNTTPSGAELETGESVTLSAAGYGPGALTYQWKKDGANIDGQTGADLALSSVAKGDAGTYSVVVTASNGGQAEASADIKVFDLPEISLNRPVEGSTTSAITHQIKLWAIKGTDEIDLATASIVINGVNVTANATVKSSVRGLQAIVDLVENADQATIPGLFLGYETLAPGTDNAMTVTFAFEPVGGDRVFTNSWSYTLYDASSGGGRNITKMTVNQIFQRGEDLYVIWPGSPSLMLERNSDCKGGTWEAIPSTVGKGIHVEKNCGTKAFFRLVHKK